MKNKDEIASFILLYNATLLQGLSRINTNAGGALFIVDDDGKLVGSLTDGDVRRALLRGVRTEEPVSHAMHTNPIMLLRQSTQEKKYKIMDSYSEINCFPIVNDAGVLVDIEVRHGATVESLPNEAVIMCGGLGSRLGQLTKNCPKPMLKVDGKPILERIMSSLIKSGISRFFFATNYLKEKIENYFGNGEKWGVQITYLREKKRMGTGGALSLLPHIPEHPILVMNADILTKFNVCHLFDFHTMAKPVATMAITEFRYQNPYGVVRHDATTLLGIDEKPTQSWFINAGIYVIEPRLLPRIPSDIFIDMPTLLLKEKERGETVSVCPICEKWIDIGREADYMIAQQMVSHT